MNLEHWKPCPRPGGKVLEGVQIRLEPLVWSEHADGLYAAVAGADRADIWTYIPFGPFADQSEFVETFEAARVGGGWETLVFRRKSDDRIVGMSSYMRIRPEHGSAEIGCVAFGPDLKRTRGATEAMYLMARHVLGDLGYRRYEWKCDSANLASRSAAERLGFEFEGVFRHDMVVKGANRDTAWFSIVDTDWPRLERAFQTWLAHEGEQVQSLREVRASLLCTAVQ